MSLTFDVSKVPNYHENFPAHKHGTEEHWNPITEVLVFFMMVAGPLVEGQADEFFFRLDTWQHTINPLLNDHGKKHAKPRYITLDEVYKHVGIKTNTSAVSNAAWNKKLVDALRREHKANHLSWQ